MKWFLALDLMSETVTFFQNGPSEITYEPLLPLLPDSFEGTVIKLNVHN